MSFNKTSQNPLDGRTTIRFIIPQDEYVTLKVYDAMGKVVAEIWMRQALPESTASSLMQVSCQVVFTTIHLKRAATEQVKKMVKM